MVDVLAIALIVAFFVATALLVHVLGRVTEEASAEREPEFAETSAVTADQRSGLVPDGRK